MPTRSYDTGSVSAALRDVHGDIIRDRVRITFVNQRVRSFNRQVSVTFKGKAVLIQGDIPAGPNGLYQVFITPEKYREKSVFLMVPTGKPATIDEVFFIEPGKADPKFPSYAALGRERHWAKLIKVLEKSGLAARTYRSLDSRAKAGIFNLFAKMEATRLSDQSTVFDHVEKVSEPKPARFYAQVSPALHPLVMQARDVFHSVPGSLHSFPAGWTRIEELGSFKTLDRAGNLQLTFATNARGEFLADADIDDHQGVEHAFDVIKHKVSGKDTHPYDIHEILVFFQGIDPGYELV